MFEAFKKMLKVILPDSITGKMKLIPAYFKRIAFTNRIRRVHANYQKVLIRIKNKDKIKVAFFLVHHADWKYEGVYRLMEEDDRFDPIVVICPYIVYGEEFMLNIMDQAFETFKNDGYNVIKSLNSTSGDWLDVKKELGPDLICFTSPWKLTKSEYLIDNFFDTLTCYVPYGYETSHLHETYYNSEMQNLVWKFYLENEIHKGLSIQYSRNKGNNTVVTGYPGMDRFLLGNKKPIDVWKIKDRKLKRVIWAPHHSIPGMGSALDYSTFLEYYDSMFQIALEFQDKIQFAFKPHPILKEKLSKNEVWGKVQTEEYYQNWSNLCNGQLEEGDYMDLFFTSDAMIHDCGSFVAEYLYTGNPVLYLMRDDEILERFNEVGQRAIKTFYHGKNLTDVYMFLQKVVLDESDTMKRERSELFNKIIKAPGTATASGNIYQNLVSEIFASPPGNER